MASTRVNEIDLLRFIAALSVVVFHYAFRGYTADSLSAMPYPVLASVARYGYLGVELFFMISGFVILATAANGSLRGFVISRMVRLYPAFWACCTITFVVMATWGGPRYCVSLGQYLINMTMLSDFVNVPPLDGVYWSLFVELRFYALVAAVLAIGRIARAESFLALWLAASVVLAFIPVTGALPVKILRYFLIAEHSAFFIAGAICFLIWSKGPSTTRIAMTAVCWGLAVFQASDELKVFEKHYGTAMSGAAVATIVTAFFAVMLLVAMRRTGAFGQRRWLSVGALTYPLYLLHENVGFIVFNAAYPALNAHLIFWGTLVLMLAAAYAVHVVVEKQFASSMKAALGTLADRVLPAPKPA